MLMNARQLNRILLWSRSLRELFYQGKVQEVLEQYHNRPTSDLPVQTYCILFKAFTLTKNWSEGEQLHTQIKTNNIKLYHDQRLKIIILNMYAKAGDFHRAEEILADLIALLPLSTNPHHIDPTAFSILMTGYNLHHQAEKTLKIFARVQHPDAISYLLSFQACSQLKDFEQGKRLVQKLTQSKINLRKELKLQTALFDMYGKCGDVFSAEDIFQTIENPTIAHYNSLFKIYNDHQMYEKTCGLYEQLKQNQKNIKPDSITFSCLFYSVAKIGQVNQCQDIFNDFNSSAISLDHHPILQVNLINAFGKCKDMITSQQIFDQIAVPRITAVYNALMKGYNSTQKPLITLSILDKIPQPDAISYLTAINACAQIAMLRRARSLYQQILKNCPAYQTNIRMMTALIDMFGKCADVVTAEEVFNAIGDKGIITYNTLINVYGLNGDGLKALEVYYSLLRNSTLSPNEQTYSIILNACSHSLLVNQAREIFNSIPFERRNVFVYATIIDALCRASNTNEAEILLAEYEKSNKKYPPMYITLLTAYARLPNLDKVIEIHHLIKEYFPNDIGYISSSTVLLANTHAFLGNMPEAIRLRTNSALNGIVKFPGISWTETKDGQIHEFIAHDNRHAQTKEIYEELKRIADETQQDGYISDERWITSDRAFNDDLNPLNSHSERLALAYQLFLRRKEPTNEPIQITKNLRICGDCHEIFKRMTRIHQGLIILARDRTRQHRFHQGNCSCQDYF